MAEASGARRAPAFRVTSVFLYDCMWDTVLERNKRSALALHSSMCPGTPGPGGTPLGPGTPWTQGESPAGAQQPQGSPGGSAALGRWDGPGQRRRKGRGRGRREGGASGDDGLGPAADIPGLQEARPNPPQAGAAEMPGGNCTPGDQGLPEKCVGHPGGQGQAAAAQDALGQGGAASRHAEAWQSSVSVVLEVGGWQAVWDPGQGAIYFGNASLGVTQWDAPHCMAHLDWAAWAASSSQQQQEQKVLEQQQQEQWEQQQQQEQQQQPEQQQTKEEQGLGQVSPGQLQLQQLQELGQLQEQSLRRGRSRRGRKGAAQEEPAGAACAQPARQDQALALNPSAVEEPKKDSDEGRPARLCVSLSPAATAEQTQLTNGREPGDGQQGLLQPLLPSTACQPAAPESTYPGSRDSAPWAGEPPRGLCQAWLHWALLACRSLTRGVWGLRALWDSMLPPVPQARRCLTGGAPAAQDNGPGLGEARSSNGRAEASTAQRGSPSGALSARLSEQQECAAATGVVPAPAGGQVEAVEQLSPEKALYSAYASNMPGDMPQELLRYWTQRYSLFRRFDRGVRLDADSWFSVTPEVLAQHHAQRCGGGVAVDAFCGVGGNLIHLAATCPHVIGIDIDPARLHLAAHNLRVYSSTGACEGAAAAAAAADLVAGDSLLLLPHLSADVVFLSPPWGGPAYLSVKKYDTDTMLQPVSGFQLLHVALQCAPSAALFLPRSTPVEHLRKLWTLVAPHLPCEVEKAYLNGKLKAITMYLGSIALTI